MDVHKDGDVRLRDGFGKIRINIVDEVAKRGRVRHLHQGDDTLRTARPDIAALSAGFAAGDAKARVVYEIANNTRSEFAVIEYN